jgi:two-component system sensor histidine kinase NreB
MNNAAKHSDAGLLRVSLSKEDQTIVLGVEDDGKGFDVEKGLSRHQLGLIGMQERTKLAGGLFSLSSQMGRGTTIRAVWPCE